MPKKYYVISKAKLHEEVKNKMFTTYKPIELPEYEELTPQWHGKKIPLTMWREILAFMKLSYDELKSETMLFLYYDDTKKQPWSYWIPPQITSGMTVKSNPEHSEFQAQRAQYPDIMFGTVHHHCSTSAFQSGTDEADETNREGFHFTVGNLDKPDDIDIHFRWCLDNQCHELDNLSIAIAGAESPFKKDIELTDDMLELQSEYMNQQLAKLPDLSKYDFTEQMKNIDKPAYTLGTYSKKNTEPLPVVPTLVEEQLTVGDIVDEILFAIKFDTDIESCIETYYQTHEPEQSSKKITDLYSGFVWDTEYARVLHGMLTNSEYHLSRSYESFLKAFNKHLDMFKEQGYILSDNDIIQELESYPDEDRETIQPMDNPPIL
tara:strand:- start:313 stop:1443 length:1131 start_codon:yes stop_codon:yes gene_type:complete